MSQDTREEWRPIAGFPNYQVSNRGIVMNLMSGKVLKNRINGNGYAFVALRKGDGTKPKNCKVHRLVAQAFIPNPNNLSQVNHIDECKTNNNVDNLEWCTASQNQRHSAHQKSCRISQLTLDDEFVKIWESSWQINRETGYNTGNIVNCCKGRQRSAYGYIWRYVNPDSQRVVNRPVAALTMDGDLIAEYKSAAEASRCLKISYPQVYRCLNGTYKSTHGLKFINID